MDHTPVTPVAVIGMACRLPGGIDSPEMLWQALLRGDDLITEIAEDRWDADEYYDPEPGVPGRSVSRWGGFLDDVAGFDAESFGIGEREATAIDPQHRLLLQTSWEAVEHAGVAPKSLIGSRTGVFVGMCHHDYAFVSHAAGALDDAYAFTGTAFSMGSGRVSYALGLRGPSMTVDTACSSSLLAVHLACRSLHEGESDLALAGGCMVMLEPHTFNSASAQGMLSPTGRCRPFDAAADGYVRSEGCAMVLLKRLPDALRDNDRVLAVLRGTATNQDGRTDTISTPSADAQVLVYRAALAAAGVDADTVGVVEAHGTGTPAGDPIEFASLAQVYGLDGNRTALGSAKSNLGHTEAAAGAVGIIKAILSLRHATVPPMVHHRRLPAELARIDTGLFVPQEITPWPTNGHHPRRAAVSSYGMSGTNVHVILEQAPEPPTPHHGATPAEPAGPQLFVLSASSAEALRQTSRRLADWLQRRDDSLRPSDLAYTLARRRAHRPVRTAVIAGDHGELVQRLREVADGDTCHQAAVGHDDRGPVWVFSGQGSQWPAMGADLLANEPVFAATVAAAEPLIARESGFSVTEAMTAVQTVTGIDRVQPTLFAMQVALATTMTSYGVAPAAVIGHSLGEVAAAVVAGALSLDDGVRVICRRSRLCTRVAGNGAMAAVEMSAPQVREQLARRGANDVVIAVVASPQSTVIGGATQTVRELVAAWEEGGVLAREVAVDVASHTPQVDPILDELAEVLAGVTPSPPGIPYYSATLFDPRERPVCDAGYWRDNLRHAVRFSAAVRAALQDGHRVFCELSPHPLLTRAVEQTATSLDIPVAAVAACRRDQRLPHGLRGLVADLHSAGAAVDFSALSPGGRLVDAPLPAWTNRRLFFDTAGHHVTTNTVVVHPLLGQHVRLMEEPARHAWTAQVGTAALPWLADHRIHHVPALPGAAYCEMALAAAHAVLGDRCEVRDIRFEQMLLLDEHSPVGAVASVQAAGLATFDVETLRQGERVRRATAALCAVDDPQGSSPAQDIDALLTAHPRRLEGGDVRRWFDTRGVQFGPAFTGLVAAYLSEGTIDALLAEIALPSAIRTRQAGYHVHPALLDACFQSVAAHPAVQEAGNGGLLLPLGVRRLRTFASTRNVRYCLTRVTACGPDVEADIDVMDGHGTVVLAVRGLLLGTGFSESANQDRLLGQRLLTIEWQRREPPQVAPGAPGSWLLVNLGSAADDADPLAARLAEALERHGAHRPTMSWPRDCDHVAQAERLRGRLHPGGFDGVIVVTGPMNGTTRAARDCFYVQQLVRIARAVISTADNPPRLYVITRGAQAVLADDRINLEQAGLRGLVRVIGAEHPHLHITHIDVDEHTDAGRVARHLLAGWDEDETAWRQHECYTARLRPTALRPDERRPAIVNHERDGMRTQIRNRGDLQTMELVAFERVSPGAGQIEVAVTASSINFADALGAFGRYRSFGPLPGLGTDFAGVVTAVGPDVTGFQVGDRVGGLSANGCWATFVICEANLAVKIPRGLTDAQAAAVTTASATAWYGLHDLARIKAGDKVLIHSATGGVGQAALAIARAAGAEVFATAGNAKRRNLLRDMGVEHVYDSRSIEFAEQIRRDTNGDGVDIVLNSLTGAAQRAGVDLLTFGGRFVEIGKRDIYGDTRLGLFPFRRNLSFFALDLWLMSTTHPDAFRDLVSTVYRLTAQGVLPMPQRTHYPLAEAAAAIRVMSAAEHTGKLILDIPRAGSSRVVMPPEHVHVFRPDGAYIITGGLGGLGLFLAEKMAAAGAGRIVLNSRSAPTQKVAETIELIRATGSDIAVEVGDIAIADTAQRLVAAATATGLSLRGVLHAAAVVEDATLATITDELIERDWAPKVHGAWNLHQATASEPLDWFCSFSSAAALLGSPGQGAYAAANSWLDAFTHWRRAQGLPATAIAWAAWAEIGRGAALADSGDITMITPDEGAYAFEALLRHTRSYSGYAPIDGSPWLTALARRSRFAEAFQSATRSEHSRFRTELEEVPLDEWPTRLRRLISEQVGLILRHAVDPDRPLSQYGLDSLGNLELRTRIETETGVRIHSTDITTVRGLANHLCEALAPTENTTATM
ncbi:type I polyketide synthase [Mycobacterium shinjukuense]|uniref:Mycocerosic acid synthase-like polyketide synthase n=1 Tax=Mycobacterium shinjukuense TaxID=398694 RepID=A0A7I7MNP1_9MYCO|nr:type I polyketide synthase [Mycobacterium shinjukuense]MCV6985880.1 type I polyketide synthase [Mycobacterium shinjukuense]ORB71730.1 polyketide synthase [Mycobacterium shinjukuense]BBX73765.1 mycocerosic acid synthase-like polyketide synthase [Mycobacterium shinjukuense]